MKIYVGLEVLCRIASGLDTTVPVLLASARRLGRA